MKNRTIQIVQVSWVDSEALNQWSECASLKHELEEIQTVGLLIHSDEKVYLIASTYDGSNDSINAAIWIPRACVRTVQPLGLLRIRSEQ